MPHENCSFYAAYGSNLNERELAKREIELEPIGPARLLDHDLAFTRRSTRRHTGVLDILPARGSLTPAFLFRADDRARCALDEKEGVGSGAYERTAVWVRLEDGSMQEAWTYRVRDPSPHHIEPSPEYLEVVRAGRVERGLPTHDLESVARGDRRANAATAIFVYGTLMRGEERSAVLARHSPTCWILADALVDAHLRDCGDYPGLVLGGGGQPIAGELVRLPPDQLAAALRECDAIEGFDSWGSSRPALFERRLVHVGVGDGRTRGLAWTYVLLNPGQAPRLSSPDWRAHRGVRTAFLQRLASAHLDGLSDEEVARLLAGPFDTSADVRRLFPLHGALARGALSERRLAQASNRWTASVG